MKRRAIVRALISLPALSVAYSGMVSQALATTRTDIKAMQARWQEFLPTDFEAPERAQKVEFTESQWRERLNAAAFDVLRREGTERPFTSPLNKEQRAGVFVCAGCELPLFTTEMKYDSGTGWPSFFTAIPKAMDTKRDFKMIWPRTEYHCTRCGGHQGHIFDDGPAPTHKRWCNNGVALRFLAKSSA